MQKTFGSILLLLILLTSACRKIDIVEEKTCEPIAPHIGLQWVFLRDEFHLDFPCWNPKNPDEVMFVFEPVGATRPQLIVYNRVTGEKKTIYEGNIIYGPSWGKNGWILMNLYDQNIYKIKENGDSLTQLTFSAYNWKPVWNADATKFAYYNNPTGRTYYYICDPDGNPIDTLENSGIDGHWNQARYVPSPSGGALAIADIVADSMIVLQPFPDGGRSGYGGVFVNETQFVYAYLSGVYTIDIQSRKITLIHENCNSAILQKPDYAPQIDRLLWVKKEYEVVSGNELLVKTKLITMSPDGQNEEEIEVRW